MIDAHWFVLATSGSSCSITADLNSAGQIKRIQVPGVSCSHQKMGTAGHAMKYHEFRVVISYSRIRFDLFILGILEFEHHPLRLKRATCSHCRSELCQSKPSPSRPQCLPVSSLGEGQLPFLNMWAHCLRHMRGFLKFAQPHARATHQKYWQAFFQKRIKHDGTIF